MKEEQSSQTAPGAEEALSVGSRSHTGYFGLKGMTHGHGLQCEKLRIHSEAAQLCPSPSVCTRPL